MLDESFYWVEASYSFYVVYGLRVEFIVVISFHLNKSSLYYKLNPTVNASNQFDQNHQKLLPTIILINIAFGQKFKEYWIDTFLTEKWDCNIELEIIISSNIKWYHTLFEYFDKLLLHEPGNNI